MDDLCTACLCSGRNLYILSETELNGIYQLILNETLDPQCCLRVSVHICWECHALLRRFQKFRVQVKNCYVELLRYLEQDPPSLPQRRRPKLQVHHTQSISIPESVKEELDLLEDLKSETDEVHEEPETVAYDFTLDKDSNKEEKVTPAQIKKDKQVLKRKVKKKVKLKKGKTKKKKTETSVEQLLSDGVSDREIGAEDQSEERESVAEEDGCEFEDMYADVKNEDPRSLPQRRRPKLQVYHTQSINIPESVKEELDLLEDLKCETDEVHKEPETVAYDFTLDKDSNKEKKVTPVQIKKDKQVLKRKVKKKVKLKKGKTKKKKTETSVEQSLSDGVSDREIGAEDQYEERESVAEEDGCEFEDMYADVKNEETHMNGVAKQKRQPRSKEVLPEKPTCADCGKTFSSRKTYRYHRNVLHRGQNRYPCPRCGRVYQWKSNLGRHMRTHKARDTGELYCEKCDKTFASVATYRQHLRISRRHVPESDYNFMCNECGKKFVDKTRLRDHIDWEHLKKVKYRCQICNNAFKCHTTLYVHTQNIHTNKEKKDNLCHVCGKSYQNASKLKYHIVAMHTSETPHRCAQCGAAFGWYSSLYRHMREVHYGMKVPAKNVKKSKKLLRDLLMHPHENPLAQTGPP